MTHYTPLQDRTTRRRLLPAVTALLTGAVLVAVGVLWGRGTITPTAAPDPLARVPHGPAVITDGVPSGFTPDGQGAATAAVAFLQVCWSAAPGAVNPTRIRSVMLAANPSPAATELTGTGTGRPATRWAQQLTPVGVQVTSLTGPQAVVSVWAVSVYGAETGGGGAVTSQVWSTATVSLSWESGDWKTADVTVTPGPDPDQARSTGFVPLTGALTVFNG